MRCAICFVPPPDDALTLMAAHWLRRDPYSGAKVCKPVEGLVEEDHAFITAMPRRMGFHGSLKPPFELSPDYSIEDLEAALDKFCRRAPVVTIEATRITLIENFFALTPAKPCAELDELAADIVIGFDGFRSPLTEQALARGDVSRLDARQFANLIAWGHPNVLDRFRYRMTLTGLIDRIERDHVAMVLDKHFGAMAQAPMRIAQLALFVEPEPYAPFLVHSVHKFAQKSQRRIA